MILLLPKIIFAKIFNRKIALCDVGDVDGIASATLFKIKYPKGIVILASPVDVVKGRILKLFYWDFVADLPCPGKVYIRADHHKTNLPCAVKEFYDPKASCSAILALKALDLEGNVVAEKLAKIAIETDTANIVSEDAMLLDNAVSGADYFGRLYIIDRLSRIGLNALNDSRIKEFIDRSKNLRNMIKSFANSINIKDEMVLVFKKNIGFHYRYLCILLEKMGAKFTCIIVPRGFREIRLYLGSNSKYDVSVLARYFGGGGHKVAAGASIKTFRRNSKILEILYKVKVFLKKNCLKYIYVYSEDRFELREL